jgi:hypothetical protein
MTLPQAMRLFEYWQTSPPEHEMIAMLARVYTTWRGAEQKPSEADHRASLEQRWKSGVPSVKDLFAMTGGEPVTMH